jgi:hypothetical protein
MLRRFLEIMRTVGQTSPWVKSWWVDG